MGIAERRREIKRRRQRRGKRLKQKLLCASGSKKAETADKKSKPEGEEEAGK